MRPTGQPPRQPPEEALLGQRKLQAGPSLRDERVLPPQPTLYSQEHLHREALEICRKALRSKEQARSSRTDHSFAIVFSRDAWVFLLSPSRALSAQDHEIVGVGHDPRAK